MPSRRVLAGAGAGLAVVLAGCFAVGPIARARVRGMAEARRLDVAVDAVSWGWFAVELRGVTVAPAGAKFVSARVESARVELGALLGIQRVEAHRAEVRIVGTAEEVDEGIRAWRAGATEASGKASRTPIAVDGIGVAWVEREGGTSIAEVSGGSIVRSEAGWHAAFEAAHLATRARRAGVQLDVIGGDAKIGAGGVIEEARASRVAIAWSGGEDESGDAKRNGAEPAPPPLPIAPVKNVKGDQGGNGAALAARMPLPDPRAVHARLVALGAIARDRVRDGARIEVDALAFELREGAQRLTVGQGPMSVARKGPVIAVQFRTRPDANGTPLQLDATVPLEAGDATISLAGGPVSLALLGVEEKAAGLVEVDRTTVGGQGRVSLSAAGDVLTFDGQVGVRGLAISSPKLALDVVRGVDATVLARGVLDDHGALRLDDAEVTLGALHARAHGDVEQTSEYLTASLALELPSATCQSLLQSIPSALVPTLEGAEMTGSFGMKGRLAFDSRKLDDAVIEWNVDDRCAMHVVPEGLAHERFTQPFEHTVYLPDGTLESETTGPTSDAWTDLEHVSPFMQVAVLTTEDGAFYRHHGFNRAAIRGAVVANLKAGRFVRGASTITMQLAKNLFLSRDKTLARKLEEVILADYLEQAFTKQEMMELYLNVIEFGPDVYGVTNAAMHYFGRKPDELNLAECLFLSSLLPSPIRFHKLAEKPVLSESWMKHLHDLMGIAARLGTISEAELEDGLKEVVAFHDAKEPLPPSRPSVMGTHFQAMNPTGAEWEATP